MGGEKTFTASSYRAASGSPPHGRGKAAFVVRFNSSHRITPAWAGKRQTSPDPVRGLQDHPRMGGEKCPAFHRYLRGPGSPPHGRGKVYSCY